jgi:hypothetical protein
MDYVTVQGKDIVGESLPFGYRTRSGERPFRECSVLGIIYRSGEKHRREIALFQVSIPIRGTSSSGASVLRPIDP